MTKKLSISTLLLLLMVGFLTAQGGGKRQKGLGDRSPYNQRQRSIYLEGTVILDDGGEVGGSVVVDLLCHGSTFRQTHTLSNGTFSFQIGGGSSRVFDLPSMDASVSYQRRGTTQLGRMDDAQTMGSMGLNADTTSMDLSGCEVRAVLGGFQSDVKRLGRQRALDSSDLGVIVLHRIGGVKGSTVSLKTLTAPKRARKEYEKAQEELEKDPPDYSKAADRLSKAVKSYSEFAAAWNLLGEIRLAVKDQAGAREAFERSMAEDANYVTPSLFLAKMEIEGEHWKEAAQMAKGVIGLNPYISLAHYYSAVSHYYLGDFNTAEESILLLQQSDQIVSYPVAFYLMGMIKARAGDFNRAAGEFRQFLTSNPNPAFADQLENQMAEWEKAGLINQDEAVEH